jgi:putative methionine-R-sulfoxide reductase with GAF domain
MSKRNPVIKSVDEIGIGQKLKISYFVASIIPIVVMTYLYWDYIYPQSGKQNEPLVPVVVAIILVLTTMLSVLGLMMTSRTANESIRTLKNLNVRMDSLLDLTKNFREGIFVDVLLDSIANSATKLLNAEASSVLLYDSSGALKFEHLTGLGVHSLKGMVVKPGEGIVGWVAREGKPVLINDVKADRRFSDRLDKEAGFKTRSVVCVPLFLEGRGIGLIEVMNKKDGELFTEQDQKILFSLADHAALSIHRAKTSESSHSDFVQVTEILMSAMDHHVPEKKGHARRVARYSVRLAKGLGLNEEEQKRIYFGALLHDIGLLKYSQDDYWGLKKFELHPTLGFDMIKTVSLWQPVAPLVLSHHERFDGGGYPRGLSGQDIPFGARIISVAEVFDTLVCTTSYKPAMSITDALDEIKRNSGSQFDPQVAEFFVSNLKKEDVLE